MMGTFGKMQSTEGGQDTFEMTQADSTREFSQTQNTFEKYGMPNVANNFMRNYLKSGGQTARTAATTSMAVGKTPAMNESVTES